MNYLKMYEGYYLLKRIKFKHWKTGEELEEIGVMPPQYNNPNSDRYVIVTEKHIMDVLKSTVISLETISDKEGNF